jgi:isoleucyl-tRNA synthetase
MPFAQVHYPFENTEWFETHFPGDFIVEYVGQTRGWFYTLHVLATALFDKPAFKNAVSHGIVLGDDGQKMSKSLRNYPDVQEVFERDGSDAMRWFLMSSPILRGGNLSVSEAGIRESVRQFMLPLWNSYYFFTLYANANEFQASYSTASEQILDRYLFGKLHQLITDLTESMENFDSYRSTNLLRDFGEVLTNWFIRRSRDRFWEGDEDAQDTLYTTLETLSRLSAPLLPMISEEIWQGLTAGRSVHLTDWPKPEDYPFDEGLVQSMDEIREIASVGLALRKQAGLRVRLPLRSAVIASNNVSGIEPFVDLIREELNLKQVELVSMSEETAKRFGLVKQLNVNARALGPRIGSQVQQVIAASKQGDWSEQDGKVTAGGVELLPEEYELKLAGGTESSAIGLLPEGFLILDTELDQELQAEGMARDAIRHIQQARKDAGLDVSDRIGLTVGVTSGAMQALENHQDLLMHETLAKQISFEQISEAELSIGDDEKISIEVEKLA